MIIFSHKAGQLGNRLFQFGHLIGYSCSTGIPVMNMSFDEYAPYFQGTNADAFCRFPARESAAFMVPMRSVLFTINRVLFRVLKAVPAQRFLGYRITVADLPDYQFTDSRYFDLPGLKSPEGWHFLFGRFFRDYKNFERFQDVVRAYFTPVSGIRNDVDAFLRPLRQPGVVLVGVHMRKGDYKSFAGGKYYFSSEQYLAKMREVQSALKGQKVQFVVCSDERVNTEEFNGVDLVPGPGHLVKDLYVLAGCDLIMGPPSTFSRWASFYGQKPLCTLSDVNTPVDIRSFAMLPLHILTNFSFN